MGQRRAGSPAGAVFIGPIPLQRYSARIGTYRVLVTERAGEFEVVVHEDRSGRWRYVRGPFRYPDLHTAISVAEEIEDSLRFDA